MKSPGHRRRPGRKAPSSLGALRFSKRQGSFKRAHTAQFAPALGLVKEPFFAVHIAYAAVVCGPHGTRLFYELLSCGEPFRRMGRGGWPAMRSRQQWMASLWAARRIFLSRSKPTRKID